MKIKVEIDTIDAHRLESLLSEADLRRIFEFENSDFSNLSLLVHVDHSKYGEGLSLWDSISLKLTLYGEREETFSEIKERKKRELADKRRKEELKKR